MTFFIGVMAHQSVYESLHLIFMKMEYLGNLAGSTKYFCPRLENHLQSNKNLYDLYVALL